MESKVVRRVQQVMNILPSFSPYPSSSLPLTTTDTKGSARDNEQKSQRLWLLERSGVAEGELNAGCVSPRRRGGAGSSTSLGETASSCRMRTVEEREASAAAVAKAFCEPSEFIVLFAVARPVTYCNK